MSDSHTGVPHDLPEYTPNWPAHAKVKARVMKGNASWLWGHNCPRKVGFALGWPAATQAEAFQAAYKHVQGCW